MRRAIATVCISGTLEEKLDSIARARFDAVEIFENDLIGSPLSPRQIRARCNDLGLGIDLYQPFRDFDGVDDARFRRNLERAERKFDLMHELGAPMILLCTNVSPQVIRDDELIAGQLRTLAERAAERGIRVAYEALAWGSHINRYGHAWEVVRRADHPHLGVCLDSFHILSRGDDPAGIAAIPGDKLFFLQLADAPHMHMDVLPWSRHYRCFPGQGAFDLPAFMEPVLAAGYDGPLSLEVFNDIFRAAPNRRTALDAYASLLLLEEHMGERLRRGSAADAAAAASASAEAASVTLPANAIPTAGRSAGRVELFSPPALPRLDGVSFIEFAADEATALSLDGALTALGFERTGVHRTKQVSLYQQGEVRLVVNRQPGSHAAEHFQRHGASICALALRSDDGQRAVNRGVAFHVPREAGRIGPGETVIPALRGVDGGLLYFVSQAQEAQGFLAADFLIADDAHGSSHAGILAVDHIAQNCPPELFDTSVLFNRITLGLVPQESLELAGPAGLVRGCAMVDADSSLRITLNVTPARSGVSALDGEPPPAGIHHVALACRDAFATAQYLRDHGVQLLEVPANYYDDLEARLDIAPAVLERMRRLGVLYDRSGDGEFFHFYTRPFDQRFYFEIVQRVGGYAGFGVANTPVRLTAQVQQG